MISCLSKPISGRNTGRVQTSLVESRDGTVWLATCPMLSPVTSAIAPFFFAMLSAMRII